MFIYPYTTTPCEGYAPAVANIVRAIKEALVHGTLHQAQLLKGTPKSNVLTVCGDSRDIPPFAHPIEVEWNSVKYVVADMRGFTRINQNKEVIVSARNEYDTAYLRAMLTSHWAESSPQDLASLGSLPLAVYMRWLTEAIVRRIGLDPQEQMTIMVITGYFYLSLFREDPALSDKDLQNFAKQISNNSFIPVNKAMEIADQLAPMYSVKDYVANLKKVVNSSRLEKFSEGFLYSILLGSWFGANAREMIAVAVEHPPTFIAMVYAALRDRSYNNTHLGKLVVQLDKRDLGKTFTYNLSSLNDL
ncbi:MAG: hypothetical protein CL678_15900 [Bdellovibrionaceae bacterium]|nr:hypothetical protein [Pseudobdellovibrionaceae bacterium]|tara:strand:- start:640 stop:1548 length:909 start_codon:yes stop_codon:yes gene_type:complete